MSFPIRCMYQIIQNECIKVTDDPAPIPATVLVECRRCIENVTCPLSNERIDDETMQLIAELRRRVVDS